MLQPARRRVPRLTVLLALTLLAAACTQRPPAEVAALPDMAYAPYVNAFTGGQVASREGVRVVLAEPLDSQRRAAVDLNGLITLDPRMSGRTRFTGPSTLLFQPDQPLANGRAYTATLDLARLRPDAPDSLARLSFGFEVVPQGLRFAEVRLRPDPLAPAERRRRQVIGTLLTNDFANPETVVAGFSARQGDTDLAVDWTHDGDGLHHRFVVDGVARAADPSEVVLRFRGEALGAPGADSLRRVVVPAASTFAVTGTDLDQDAEQVATVYFSDVLDEDQDLTGLVYLADGTDVRLERRGDAVLVYPAQRRSGTVEVVVDASLRDARGNTLEREVRLSLDFADLKPAVELAGEGTVTPSSQGSTVPFRAVGLRRVDVEVLRIFADNATQFFQDNDLGGRSRLTRVARPVFRGSVPLEAADGAVDYSEWNYFALDLARYVAVEPGAIYRVGLTFGPDDVASDCPNGLPLADDAERPGEDAFDDPDYYGYNYAYDGRTYWYDDAAHDDPCEPDYYRGRGVARNLLASDIGLLAKRGTTGELLVFATDLLTTEPLAEVDVELLNLQGQSVAAAKTGPDGAAAFDVDARPFVAVARRGDERAYLRLARQEAQNLSAFDVGGEASAAGARGMIYGERGVWRPGDSIYLTLILERSDAELAAGVPVVFELRDPLGKLTTSRVIAEDAPGMYGLRAATDPDAPTGPWQATVRAGAATFRHTVRVETVMPNRLSARLTFPHDPPRLYVDSGRATLAARWLHGAPAGGLRAVVEWSAEPKRQPFPAYAGYGFTDESKAFRAEAQELFAGALDADGEASFALGVADPASMPGLLGARFTARVFERGGAFSTVTSGHTLSPYPAYVGVRPPESESYFGLDAGAPLRFDLAVLDAAGEPLSRDSLRVEVYDIAWSSWWERDRPGALASYVANRAQHLALDTLVAPGAAAPTVTLDLSRVAYGRKMIRVIDPVGGHAATATFYLADPLWAADASSRPSGAELLAFSLDAAEYAPGQRATVNLPAFPGGRALVSVEAGDRVVGYRWIEGTADPQQISVSIADDMAPNAFVHVTVVQPHAQTGNDQPIRLYGVQPFAVVDPATRLAPEVDLRSAAGPRNGELAPEEAFEVRVSEAEGRAMSYTVAVVEEGLLGITDFATPDPHARFTERRALGVRTYDMFAHVLGAFTGRLAGLLAVGGDEDTGAEAPDARANRFRPVVKYLGPFRLEPGATAVHTLEMPNYVGAVRAMVVAADGSGAYGSADLTLPVRRPLMALATLPRVLGPGETVELPVTVFATDPSIETVDVSLEGLDLLTATETSRRLTFAEPGEQIARFTLRSPERLGVARVRVRAEGAGFSAGDEVELQVRAPAAEVTRVVDAVVEPGEAWAAPYAAVGMAGTNAGALEVSDGLPVNLERRLRYLTRYPHGCLEQVVSAAFPQLYVGDFTRLDAGRAATIQRNVRDALRRLQAFQRPSGALAYWPAARDGDAVWAGAYAAHFIAEARDRGYVPPAGLLEAYLAHARRDADAWTPRRAEVQPRATLAAQAYRLFALARAGQPRLGAMNRLRGHDSLGRVPLTLLSGAYALAGQVEAARELLVAAEEAPQLDRPAYRRYSFGSPARDVALGLYVRALLGTDATGARRLAEEVSANLASGRWYSTQATAWSLLAMAAYAPPREPGDPPLAYAVELPGLEEVPGLDETFTQAARTRLVDLPAPAADSERDLLLRNTGERRLYARVVTTGTPATSQSGVDEANNLQLSVRYTDPAGAPLDIGGLVPGQDFLAVVTVKHPGQLGSYHELALTQIFPPGWEIRNDRLAGQAVGGELDHQDIRDDRVLSYFDLPRGRSVEVVTRLTAAYGGRYYLPDVYCEAMYDRDVRARVGGRWVEVKGS